MNRIGAGPEMRKLAEQLLAFEAAATNLSGAEAFAACPVCEKLRRPLSTLAGTAGYASLLTRSLTLAKRGEPVLAAVQVNPDGSLKGLEGEAAGASSVLVANLLGLLTTFIGETLTMQLLHDVWPDFTGSYLKYHGEESFDSAR